MHDTTTDHPCNKEIMNRRKQGYTVHKQALQTINLFYWTLEWEIAFDDTKRAILNIMTYLNLTWQILSDTYVVRIQSCSDALWYQQLCQLQFKPTDKVVHSNSNIVEKMSCVRRLAVQVHHYSSRSNLYKYWFPERLTYF